MSGPLDSELLLIFYFLYVCSSLEPYGDLKALCDSIPVFHSKFMYFHSPVLLNQIQWYIPSFWFALKHVKLIPCSEILGCINIIWNVHFPDFYKSPALMSLSQIDLPSLLSLNNPPVNTYLFVWPHLKNRTHYLKLLWGFYLCIYCLSWFSVTFPQPPSTVVLELRLFILYIFVSSLFR